jgi:hypothetical protein
MYGRGISNDSQFIQRLMDCLHELMADEGQEPVYLQLIAPSTAKVRFSKALNRSVTGSMNDLVYHATAWLAEGELSPFDVSLKLNDMPFAALDYRKPREAFQELVAERQS